MIIVAKQNLIPAEKIGVNDSNPIRMAIHVEPQIKHIAAYARKTLTANLFTNYLSLQSLPKLFLTVDHPVCMNAKDFQIRMNTSWKPEYLLFLQLIN